MKGEHFEKTVRAEERFTFPKSQKEEIENKQISMMVKGYKTDRKHHEDISEMGLTQATEVDNSHSPVPKAT